MAQNSPLKSLYFYYKVNWFESQIRNLKLLDQFLLCSFFLVKTKGSFWLSWKLGICETLWWAAQIISNFIYFILKKDFAIVNVQLIIRFINCTAYFEKRLRDRKCSINNKIYQLHCSSHWFTNSQFEIKIYKSWYWEFIVIDLKIRN